MVFDPTPTSNLFTRIPLALRKRINAHLLRDRSYSLKGELSKLVTDMLTEGMDKRETAKAKEADQLDMFSSGHTHTRDRHARKLKSLNAKRGKLAAKLARRQARKARK
jgi:UDP-2,3-diacylglucosamine pyrophosphatase LpxH